MSTTPAFIEDLLDRHAAFTSGYALGMAHGRAAERALVEQEHDISDAAQRAVRICESPEIDISALRRARQATRILLGGQS